MNSLNTQMLDAVTSVAKVTERSIKKTVRVNLNSRLQNIATEARNTVKQGIADIKKANRLALRNRVAGQKFSEAILTSTQEVQISDLRNNTKSDVAAKNEAARVDAENFLIDLLDLFDDEAFAELNKAYGNETEYAEAKAKLYNVVLTEEKEVMTDEQLEAVGNVLEVKTETVEA
jgi:hypothetical protein